MRTTRLLLAGLAVTATLLFGVAAATASAAASSTPTIIIGSTNFEEQAIVSNLYGDVLAHAGYSVKVEPSLGTRAVVVPALEQGQLDLEPDYAASLLAFLNGGTALPAGSNIKLAVPADKRFLSKFGATVLNPAPAIDTNVFVVTKATAKKYHLTTISSLKSVASKLVLGGPPECPTERPVRARSGEGLRPALQELQGLGRGGTDQRRRPQERRGPGGGAVLE